MVGLRTLTPPAGVRIPLPQPYTKKPALWAAFLFIVAGDGDESSCRAQSGVLFHVLSVPCLQSPEGYKFRLDCPAGNDVSTIWVQAKRSTLSGTNSINTTRESQAQNNQVCKPVFNLNIAHHPGEVKQQISFSSGIVVKIMIRSGISGAEHQSCCQIRKYPYY